MNEETFELWQGNKKFVTGTKKDLAEFTGLSLSTINDYCRPGYLESRANETETKIFNITKEINKSESRIQSEILVEMNKRGHRLWRGNAGKIQDARTGMWIKLMPKGFPDTFGFRSDDGKFIALEIKTPTGRLSEDQKRFRDFAETQPIIYGVVTSAEEAIQIVEGAN